jgi:hypothetical protein
MQVIKGPIAPNDGNALIYQVTLPGGIVLTNPCSFPQDGESVTRNDEALVVTESGMIVGRREIAESAVSV